MSRRTKLLAVTAIVLGGVIAFDVHVAAKLIASRREAAAREKRFAALMGAIRFRDQHEAGGGGAAANRANGSAGAASVRAAGANLKARQIIASDAGLLEKYMNAYRSGVDVQFGLFVHMMGLPPDVASQFEQLMADFEAHKLQVAQTAALDGLDTDDPQMTALKKELNHPTWTQLDQLLSPSQMSSLAQYRSEWPTVTLVQNFGGSLSDPTLTMDQAQQLLSVLSGASARDEGGTVIPNTVNVQQAMTAAAPILTPYQQVILSAMLQDQEAQARITQLSSAKASGAPN